MIGDCLQQVNDCDVTWDNIYDTVLSVHSKQVRKNNSEFNINLLYDHNLGNISVQLLIDVKKIIFFTNSSKPRQSPDITQTYTLWASCTCASACNQNNPTPHILFH